MLCLLRTFLSHSKCLFEALSVRFPYRLLFCSYRWRFEHLRRDTPPTRPSEELQLPTSVVAGTDLPRV